jgi:hypothetical protein
MWLEPLSLFHIIRVRFCPHLFNFTAGKSPSERERMRDGTWLLRENSM